jgi:hypothetical protein
MPEISEKLWAFLGGAGGGGGLLLAVLAYLKWLGSRADNRLADSQRRVDAFGDEMYERWQACQDSCNSYRDAYAALYYKGQMLTAHLETLPPGVAKIAWEIVQAPPPRSIGENADRENVNHENSS